MKSLSKLISKKEFDLLNDQEMKMVVGGGTYRCCCGMGHNVHCFDVTAEEVDDAVDILSYVCESSIGGCFL
jgi:hypothetical protein